jgi:hypothetical protein
MRNYTYLAALGLIAAAAAPATADVARRHGSTCAPKHASNGLVGADERGIYNASSSTSATVTCAAPDRVGHKINAYSSGFDGTKGSITQTYYAHPTVDFLRVRGRDLSSTSPLSCYMWWTEEDGFSSWAPTRYACSDASGCNDATTEYVGMFAISWDLSSYAIDDGDYVGTVCTLPPTTSSGSSYVKGLYVRDSAYADRWLHYNPSANTWVRIYEQEWW